MSQRNHNIDKGTKVDIRTQTLVKKLRTMLFDFADYYRLWGIGGVSK